MTFPDISRERVFLNVFQRRPIVNSSNSKESTTFLPPRHWEIDFRGGHILKLSDLTMRQYYSEAREVCTILKSSSQIKAVIHMKEAHPKGECETKLVRLDLLLRNAKYMQLG